MTAKTGKTIRVLKPAVYIALLVVLNIPNGPLKGVCQVRYISRTCTLFRLDEGTNAVRALIWQGVVGLMSPHAPLRGPDGAPDAFNVVRPLIGYGPESLWVASSEALAIAVRDDARSHFGCRAGEFA